MSEQRRFGPKPKPKKSCSIVGCTGFAICRGWCDKHVQRWRKHGDPLFSLREQRFQNALTRTEKQCSKCKVVKELNEFYTDTRQVDGRAWRCKDCHKAACLKRYIAAHPHYGEPKPTPPPFPGKERTPGAINSARWRANHPDKVSLMKYRRRLRQTEGKVELVHVLVLAERDNWTCQICNQEIDKTLKFPHQGYRSIDHIKPLSQGGEHSYANTRIAHWYCNVVRGDGRKES